MIVSENRLRELLDNIFNTTCPCEVCPLSKCSFEKCNIDDCEEAIMQYLQNFNVVEALEAGAHIVNDQVIFPPISLPNDFKLNVPCDSGESCISSCPWFNNCPFEDD